MVKKPNYTATKEILNTREAASLLNVTTQTIKNYIYSGKLRAIKTPGGHHRIRLTDLKVLGFDVEREKTLENFSTSELLNAYNSLLGTLVNTVETLIKALDTRDIVSSGHSSRVADMSCLIGKKLGYTEQKIHDLKLSSLLHDVGKVGISEVILGKPGRLTDQEFFLVKKHPEIGGKIISEIEHLRPYASSIRHHHERFDGRGYPDEIAGTDIELNSRIISVAGAYDFLRSDLTFRSAFSVEDALKEIRMSSGTQFDPDVVQVLTDSSAYKSLEFH